MSTRGLSTRTLYIQAAAQIILEYGHEAVTVRKLSEITGYTYPTLYHHFSDLDNLLWKTRGHLIESMVEELVQTSAQPESSLNGVKNAFRTYMNYYLDNPNIFRFFYYYQHKPAVDGDPPTELNFEQLWFNTLGFLVEEGMVDSLEIGLIARTIIYCIHGMISLNLSGSEELNREKIDEELDQIIEMIIVRRSRI